MKSPQNNFGRAEAVGQARATARRVGMMMIAVMILAASIRTAKNHMTGGDSDGELKKLQLEGGGENACELMLAKMARKLDSKGRSKVPLAKGALVVGDASDEDLDRVLASKTITSWKPDKVVADTAMGQLMFEFSDKTVVSVDAKNCLVARVFVQSGSQHLENPAFQYKAKKNSARVKGEFITDSKQIGCYEDDGNRILKDRFGYVNMHTTSPKSCNCRAYRYAGWEIGSQCFCGDQLRWGAKKLNTFWTHKTCGSKGWPWSMWLYENAGWKMCWAWPPAPVNVGTLPAGWKRVEGALSVVAISDTGRMYGVNPVQQIYTRAHGGNWEVISGGLMKIAVSNDGNVVMGVNNNWQLYYLSNVSDANPKGTGWVSLGCCYMDVSIGANAIYAIDTAQKIWKQGRLAHHIPSTSWVGIQGALSQISAHGNYVVGTGLTSTLIWEYSETTNSWTQFNGQGRWASKGKDGNLLVIGNHKKMWERVGSSWELRNVRDAIQVDVASATRRAAVNCKYDIFEYYA